MTANVAADELKGMTLVRTLIDVDVNGTLSGAAGMLAAGMTLIHSDAFAAGAFPDPEDEVDQPGWAWRTFRAFAGVAATESYTPTRIREDIRSKRKIVGDDQDMIIIWSNRSTTTAVDIDGIVRGLWLKP